MSIIKEKVLYNGFDSSLKINFNSTIGFVGNQQEIDNLTNELSNDLINPVVDIETRKFKMSSSINETTLQFYFNNSNMLSFNDAGFTTNEIFSRTSNVVNSFFILNYYDTFNPNTQRKYFTTYLSKIDNKPEYKISSTSNNQLFGWYVPISFITSQISSIVTGYVKFSFYNAKTGKISSFYNHDYITSPIGLTPQKQYFKVELNLNDNSWKFLDNTNNIVVAKELLNSSAYNERINNTYNKYDNVRQRYPTGNTYNYKTNKYDG